MFYVYSVLFEVLGFVFFSCCISCSDGSNTSRGHVLNQCAVEQSHTHCCAHVVICWTERRWRFYLFHFSFRILFYVNCTGLYKDVFSLKWIYNSVRSQFQGSVGRVTTQRVVRANRQPKVVSQYATECAVYSTVSLKRCWISHVPVVCCNVRRVSFQKWSIFFGSYGFSACERT